jgi:hypothetical protein
VKAPVCRVCGLAEWGHVCAGAVAERVREVMGRHWPAEVKATVAAEARPEGMIAPAGECEYCDRRRAYAAGAMRSLRAKRKEGG